MKETRPNNNYREFKGQLGSYRTVLTKDNSFTLWSEKFDENCHSLEGAIRETEHNFIEGCNLLEEIPKNDSTHFCILEVGFGTGCGTQTTINWWMEKLSKKEKGTQVLQFISTEIDEGLFLWSQDEGPLKSLRKKWEIEFKKIEEEGHYYWLARHSDFEIYILIGNARETVPNAFRTFLPYKPGAIFQDAFSPKKNPILWTLEWFQDLRKISSPKVKMSTYSASVSVRKAMVEAGWIISNSKGLGQKKSMTKASLIGKIEEALFTLLQKTKVRPLTDKDVPLP
jgi:tRNA U34 5-methylaminomethyl-2-thiouridine-forming methyltransferase MnmC